VAFRVVLKVVEGHEATFGSFQPRSTLPVELDLHFGNESTSGWPSKPVSLIQFKIKVLAKILMALALAVNPSKALSSTQVLSQ
jgi:hypothetical protein